MRTPFTKTSDKHTPAIQFQGRVPLCMNTEALYLEALKDQQKEKVVRLATVKAKLRMQKQKQRAHIAKKDVHLMYKTGQMPPDEGVPQSVVDAINEQVQLQALIMDDLQKEIDQSRGTSGAFRCFDETGRPLIVLKITENNDDDGVAVFEVSAMEDDVDAISVDSAEHEQEGEPTEAMRALITATENVPGQPSTTEEGQPSSSHAAEVYASLECSKHKTYEAYRDQFQLEFQKFLQDETRIKDLALRLRTVDTHLFKQRIGDWMKEQLTKTVETG